MGFFSLSPLSWVSESFRQDIGQFSTWKVFFIIKNIFFRKNVTDFRKTVKTGVDPRLPYALCLELDVNEQVQARI